MVLEAENKADDLIYINADRYDEPKEIFKFALNRIENANLPGNIRLLDVGCATGEFIHYVLQSHPDWSCSGLDISEKMIAQAASRVPKASFEVSSALSDQGFKCGDFDLVCAIGVVTHFDDLTVPIGNMLGALKENGRLLFSVNRTPGPIDTLVRYKRTDSGALGHWETGWNLFSKNTIDRLLDDHAYELSWTWSSFDIPIDIPEQRDPMRCWTTSFGTNQRQLVNGASQLIDIWFVEVTVERIND